MIEDIVIRLDFLIEDLRKSIFVNDSFDMNIVKAWQTHVNFLIENGESLEPIFNIFDSNDLIECIKHGMDAEDIAYVVNQIRDDKNNSSLFVYNSSYYNNKNILYGLHILDKQTVIEDISKYIDNIAYNILKYPYKDAYAELYREFVVPMIENQKS